MTNIEKLNQEWINSQINGEYLSCNYLEGGLVFNVQSLNICCVTQYKMGWPFLSHYNGGDISFEDLLKRRIEIISLNQNRKYPNCAKCGRLKKQIWKKRSHMFDYLIFAHFRFCNIKCKYCSIYKKEVENPKPYSLLPSLEFMFKNGLVSQKGNIAWGGGEPTILPEFENIMGFLSKYDLNHIVFSNCIIFSKNIHNLLANRKASLTVSVDSGNPDTYKKIKGKNYFERVWNNIEKYVATGGNVNVKMIFVKENYDDVEKFINRAIDAGVKNVIYDIDCNIPRLNDEESAAIVEFIKGANERNLNVIKGSFVSQALLEERGLQLKKALMVEGLA